MLHYKRMPKGRQIVLTADRSLMSNYRQNMLYGFTAVIPAEKLSKFLPHFEQTTISQKIRLPLTDLRNCSGNWITLVGGWILKIAVNWTRYGTSYFPPIIRQIVGISWKLGARHYLRVIRDSAKNRLGDDPDFNII